MATVENQQRSKYNSRSLSVALTKLGKHFDGMPSADAEAAPKVSLRKPPKGDNQLELFVPSFHDLSVKDGIGLMDMAVFRLSKRQTRKGDLIRYELSDAYVEVAGGAHGMATIYDYDLVLMAISHIADGVNKARDGQSELPSKKFHVNCSDIRKFCRLSVGGRQYDAIEKALDRLQGTYIKISAKNPNKSARRTGYFPLIAGANVVSRTGNGTIDTLEITVPDWVYDGVVNNKNPEVLTVNPDYFLISKGIGRFLYRIARKSAGTSESLYSFKVLHQRSGSTREFKKFAHELRQVIKANDLPDYHISEVKGKDGPLLFIKHRGYISTTESEPKLTLN